MTDPHPYIIATEQIDRADLPATVYRTARRLLDQAAYNRGALCIDQQQMMAMAGTEAVGTMRRHLIQLAGAGVIQYSIRECVWVAFCAWSGNMIAERSAEDAERSGEIDERSYDDNADGEMIDERSAEDAERSLDADGVIDERSSDDEGSQSDHPGSPGDPQRSQGDQNGLPQLGGYTDPLPVEGDTHQGNSPASTNGNGNRNGVEEAMAVGLLTSGHVGLSGSKAKELAANHSFQEIRRQVFHWLPEYEKGNVTAGALAIRIKEHWSVPESTAEMRRHPLWQQFRLPSEREADEAVEADIHEAMAAQRERWQEHAAGPGDQPDPDSAQPTDLWSQVLAEIGELVNLDTMDALAGSRLEEAGEVDGTALYRVVLVYPERRSYIENRLGILLRRTLRMQVGHPVLIEVEAQEQREEIAS